MKRNMVITMIAISVLMLFSLSGCKKNAASPLSEKESDLVARLNQVWTSLGWKIQADEVSTLVEPPPPGGGKALTRVTLKNPSFTLATNKLENFTVGLIFKDKTIGFKMKELVLRYNAKNQFLQLVSCNGFLLDWQYSSVKLKGEKPAAMAWKITADRITFKEQDISPLLKTTNQDVLTVLTHLIAQNPLSYSSAENMVVEHRFPDENQKEITVTTSIGTLQLSQIMNADVFSWLYSTQESAQLEDFGKLSMQGKAIYDDRINGTEIKVSVWRDKILLATGAINNAAATYYLRPSDCKNYFDYGIQVHITSVKVLSAVYPWLEKLGDIQKLGVELSFNYLTPAFTQACYEMINKIETLGRSVGKEEAEKYKLGMSLKIFSELIKSAPKIQFSISPLKSSLCDIHIKGNFCVSQLSIPIGKAIINISGMKALLSTLQQENIVSNELVKSILKSMAQSMILDMAGNGTLTIETKEDFPGQFFFNNKPIRQ